VESGCVHRIAVRAGGERARRVGEQRQDAEWRAAERRRSEARRIEDPHVGAADPRRRELRIAGTVLPAVSRRDEGARAAGSKDDVARLVAD
jgi:hypothetical protein